MADSQLIITLVLDDKASKEAAAALQGIGKEAESTGEATKKAGQEGEKATTKHKDALIKARDAVKQFHKEMFVLALALGAATAATNEWASRNDDARKSVDNITLAFKNGLAALGKFIQPMVDWVGNLAGKFNQAFGQDLNDNLEKAKTAIKNFDTDLKKVSDEFLVGSITAQEYYSKIYEGANNVISVNRQAQSQLQEIATLESQINNKSLMEAQRLGDERLRLLTEYKNNYMIAHQGMAAFTATVSQSVRTNLAGALTSIVTGAQTAKQAFAQLGQTMIQTIVEFMMQKLVAWALEKTILAGTVLATSTAAGAIAAAWAPAALLATIATLGGAAAQAPAAIAGAGAATAALLPGISAALAAGTSGGKTANVVLSDSSGSSGFSKTFHDGGIIRAHNGLAVDEVPIIAQTGEGILSRKGMSALGGNSALNMLNSGKSVLSQGGGDVYIYLSDIVINSKENIKELAEELGFEIDRKLRNARSFV